MASKVVYTSAYIVNIILIKGSYIQIKKLKRRMKFIESTVYALFRYKDMSISQVIVNLYDLASQGEDRICLQ